METNSFRRLEPPPLPHHSVSVISALNPRLAPTVDAHSPDGVKASSVGRLATRSARDPDQTRSSLCSPHDSVLLTCCADFCTRPTSGPHHGRSLALRGEGRLGAQYVYAT